MKRGIVKKKRKENLRRFLHSSSKEKEKMPLVAAAFTPETAALGGLTLGAGKHDHCREVNVERHKRLKRREMPSKKKVHQSQPQQKKTSYLSLSLSL